LTQCCYIARLQPVAGLIMAAYGIGRPLYFHPVVSSIFLLSFFLPFFPRLISAAADWMSTILPHYLSANLGRRSEMCCTLLAENTGRKNRQKFAIWAIIIKLSDNSYIIKQ